MRQTSAWNWSVVVEGLGMRSGKTWAGDNRGQREGRLGEDSGQGLSETRRMKATIKTGSPIGGGEQSVFDRAALEQQLRQVQAWRDRLLQGRRRRGGNGRPRRSGDIGRSIRRWAAGSTVSGGRGSGRVVPRRARQRRPAPEIDAQNSDPERAERQQLRRKRNAALHA